MRIHPLLFVLSLGMSCRTITFDTPPNRNDRLQRTVAVSVIDEYEQALPGITITAIAILRWKSLIGEACQADEDLDAYCYEDVQFAKIKTGRKGTAFHRFSFQDLSSAGLGDWEWGEEEADVEVPDGYRFDSMASQSGQDTTFITIRLERKGLASSVIPVLSDDQRRAFLNYYAPIVAKRGDELDRGSDGHVDQRGWDWCTNWTFDDASFKNNDTWKTDLHAFIDQVPGKHGKIPTWNIRPTLYTALVEFMEPDRHGRLHKCLKLIYHIYHAIDKNNKLHDWEHVEIRIDSVTGFPGKGETVSYVGITTHKTINVLKHGNPALSFLETSDGRHILIWQAQWSGPSPDANDALNGHELQFVTSGVDSAWEPNLLPATVETYVPYNGVRNSPLRHSNVPYHYLFVNRQTEASTLFSATEITNRNARHLASGKPTHEIVPRKEVRTIAYELQDMADIIPSMLSDSDWKRFRFLNRRFPLVLTIETSVRELGTERILIDKGPHIFFPCARRDPSNMGRGRTGYIAKSWFWGKYRLNSDGGGEMCHHQHDLYAFRRLSDPDATWESVDLTSKSPSRTAYPLPRKWNTARNGGFDGRWVQLFDDRPDNRSGP